MLWNALVEVCVVALTKETRQLPKETRQLTRQLPKEMRQLPSDCAVACYAALALLTEYSMPQHSP